MAPCQDYVIFISAVLEIFKLFIILTVIDYALENELIFSQSPRLIERHHVRSTAQGDLLRLADKNLFLLEVNDRIVYSQV